MSTFEVCVLAAWGCHTIALLILTYRTRMLLKMAWAIREAFLHFRDEQFLEFIEDQLVPEIEKKVKTYVEEVNAKA
jgi:hypothetical protein